MQFIISPRENILRAIEWKNPLWLPCPMFDGSVKVIGSGMVEHRREGVDDWGVVWALRDPFSDGFPVDNPIKNLKDLERYQPPRLSKHKILEPILKSIHKVNRHVSLLALDHGWGIFERAWLLLGGMHKLFLLSRQHPDAVHQLMDMVLDVKLEVLEIVLREVEIDMVLYGDDWGMEDRLLFSPKWWRLFIKPRHKKLYSAVKKADLLCCLHSDGRIEGLIPELIEMGVDILNIQRECNNWPKILKDFQGSITLWGGVSARTLDKGSAKQIAKEVTECIELGREGGVIMAPGHSLRYRDENIETMRRVWEEKGKYQRFN